MAKLKNKGMWGTRRFKGAKTALPDDSGYGCGWWIFKTCDDDSFFECCKGHDDLYTNHGDTSQKEADLQFYNCCLTVAGDSNYLKYRAWLFYGIVRSLGWMFW